MLGLGWAGHVVYVGTLGMWPTLWASSVHFVRGWGQGSDEYFRHFYSSSSLTVWCDSPHWCVHADLSFPHRVIEFCLLHLCCPKFSSALQAVDLVMSTSRLHSALLPHTPSSSGFPIMLQIFQLVDWDWRAGKCFDTKTRYCNSNGYDITQRRVFNLQQTIRYLSFQKCHDNQDCFEFVLFASVPYDASIFKFVFVFHLSFHFEACHFLDGYHSYFCKAKSGTYVYQRVPRSTKVRDPCDLMIAIWFDLELESCKCDFTWRGW